MYQSLDEKPVEFLTLSGKRGYDYVSQGLQELVTYYSNRLSYEELRRSITLKSRSIIVNLISHTTTEKGLKIRAKLDKHQYKTGIKVGKVESSTILIKKIGSMASGIIEFSPEIPFRLFKLFLRESLV
jgi:hypothetical protein